MHHVVWVISTKGDTGALIMGVNGGPACKFLETQMSWPEFKLAYFGFEAEVSSYPLEVPMSQFRSLRGLGSTVYLSPDFYPAIPLDAMRRW